MCFCGEECKSGSVSHADECNPLCIEGVFACSLQPPIGRLLQIFETLLHASAMKETPVVDADHDVAHIYQPRCQVSDRWAPRITGDGAASVNQDY